MINVYSFQKMISTQDCPSTKNISKTSHFTFGQNYKKLIANSKASFDFRKFLQKNNNSKRNFATRQDLKRNPLQQVSSSQSNVQNLLHNKAFKIRCYSKRTPKQNEKNQQDQILISKIMKHKPKIYQMKQRKSQSTAKKVLPQNKKCIRMHKFDNFEELEQIASNIKIFYNDFISESDKNSDKALVLNLSFLINCLKSSSLKLNEKQREKQYFKKKIIYMLKRIIQEKYTHFPMERTKVFQERPQIIFKVDKQQQICDLIKTMQECDFNSYYCIFSIQNRYVESVGTYNLTKINNLAQNIVVLDTIQSFTDNPPLVNSRHFVALSTISQKSNFGNAIQTLFFSLQNLEIRFTAEQFETQQKRFGIILDVPVKKLIEKTKQKRTIKNCKRSSRQKKQRCQSSYQNSYCLQKNGKQQSKLDSFKQKILKYLKIVGNESQNGIESKKSKQISNQHNQQFECMTGRQINSKTNYQVVSELIRLNSHVNKQISNYQRKMQDVQIDFDYQEKQTIQYLRFEKMYVNTLH